MHRLLTSGAAVLGALLALQGSAMACDLTGHWRSTLGALDLVQTPPPPVVAQPTAGELVATGEPPQSPGQSLLAGAFDTAKGRGQLVGVLDGSMLSLRWAQPESFAAPQDAGDVAADVSVDCDSIEGGLRKGYDGDFGERFVARRVAAPATDAADYDAAKAALEQRLAASRAAHAAGDRSLFDLDALALRLGPEPEAIFAFVRDAIGDEPYAGVLRGAEGTLIAGAGNAADKALLLAALLERQGHEVRFANASLPADRLAPLLVARAATAVPAEPSPAPEQALLDAFGLTAEDLAVARNAQAEATTALAGQVAAEAADEMAFLDGLLAEASLPAAVPNPAIARAVADHWWVQLKTAEGWRDLDPTPLGALGGIAAERTLPALPPSLEHRVEIMVFIERSDGTVLSTERVGGWSLATASVMRAGLPSFRLLTLPADGVDPLTSEWSIDELRQAAKGLSADWYLGARSFQPFLLLSNGETQPGLPFDLAGDVQPEDWQLRLAHNMERSVGGGLESAGGVLDNLLGGETAAPAVSRLTAVWYEFRLIAPDGSSESHLRTLVDRLGPARRAEGVASLPDTALSDEAVKLRLATTSDLLITGGPLRPEFALWHMGESFLASAPFLEDLLDLRFGRRSFSPSLLADANRFPNELLVFDAMRQAIARRIGQTAGGALVQSQPNLLMLQQGVEVEPDGTLKAIHRFDLIDVDLVDLSAGGAGALLRRYGVEVTVLERLLLPKLLEPRCVGCLVAPGIGTDAVFEQARAGGTGFAVLSPQDQPVLAQLELTDDSKAYLAGQLAAGWWIVLPRRPVELQGERMLGWWRIDPATGATLGMMQSGAGEGVTEYIVVIVFVIAGGNVMASVSTVAMSPFDDKDQGFFGALACGFVAAICPHRFGFNLPIEHNAGDVYTCSVDSLIAGVDCPKMFKPSEPEQPMPSNHCGACGAILPPR